MSTCPICEGRGVTVGYACPGFHRFEKPCDVCEGSGEVPDELAFAAAEAQDRRDARVARGESFAAAAAAAGMTLREYRTLEVPYAAAMAAKGAPE